MCKAFFTTPNFSVQNSSKAYFTRFRRKGGRQGGVGDGGEGGVGVGKERSICSSCTSDGGMQTSVRSTNGEGHEVLQDVERSLSSAAGTNTVGEKGVLDPYAVPKHNVHHRSVT